MTGEHEENQLDPTGATLTDCLAGEGRLSTEEVIQQFVSQVGFASKRRLKWLTALTIVALVSLFFYTFVRPLQALDELPQYFGDLPQWLLNLGGVALLYMVVNFISINDQLQYADPSRNRYAKAFQEHWPSRHIAAKLDLSQEQANHKWFEVFNTWADPKHPRHSQRERTFRRGYMCRYVYSCLRLLEMLFWLSALATVLPEVLTRRFGLSALESSMALGYRIAIVVFIGFLYLAFRLTNRPSIGNLTGVWEQYAEVNRLHKAWIDENIKKLGDFDKFK